MKRFLLPSLFVSLFALLPVASAADSTLLAEAQRAYTTGDIPAAKQKFAEVLKFDPKNVTARNYLKMIAASETKEGKGRELEKQLNKLVIPSLDFKEATLSSSLNFLRQQAEKLSSGQVKANFVLQPGVNESAIVTLRLSDVPFTEVLRYVGEIAKVKFVIEPYAISVRPVGGGALPESVSGISERMPTMPQ